MQISDEEKARSCLERIGYYRLSAYWYPNRASVLRKDPDNDKRIIADVLDNFRDKTTFSDVLNFYVFDKKLRMIVLDALERIEISIRTDIAILLGARSTHAHRDPAHLHGRFTRSKIPLARVEAAHAMAAEGKTRSEIAAALQIKMANVNLALDRRDVALESDHSRWLERLDEKFQSSKEDFSKHFKNKYPEDHPPIWVSVEMWDFGTMSHFFGGMLEADKDAIANKYGFGSGVLLGEWLRNLNDVRNFCAHHSRLWNRNMPFTPSDKETAKVAELGHIEVLSRFYASATVIRFLLKTINPNSMWHQRFKDHVLARPPHPYVTMASAGFPEGWVDQEIWK